jgi:hypothetical protein
MPFKALKYKGLRLVQWVYQKVYQMKKGVPNGKVVDKLQNSVKIEL